MSFQMSELEIDDVAYLTGEDSRRKRMADCGSGFCRCSASSKRRYSSGPPPRPFHYCTLNQCRLALALATLAVVGILLNLILTGIKSGNGSNSSDHKNGKCSPTGGLNTSLTAGSISAATHLDTIVGINRTLHTVDGQIYPWNEIRLPTDVMPLHYEIFMHPNLTTFACHGSVEILLHAQQSTDMIVLHVKELQLSTVSLATAAYKPIKIRRQLQYDPFEQLLLHLEQPLQAQRNYTLKIEFSRRLEEKLEGFYLSSYVDLASNRRKYLATTHFEPTFARSAFPCFDEPSFKATFALKLVHEPQYEVFFNADQQTKAIYNRDGLMITAFDASVRMSTYLVAFVVCDFKTLSERTPDGVHVRVIVPRDQYSRAEYALRTATSVLAYFQQFFNLTYPLSKLDLVAVPDFAAGAMENWGLITFRTTMILFDPNVSSNEAKENVAIVIAHELAHQWFGNLVTMEWWNDLWLNEGFASYVEYLGVAHLHPDWRMLDQFVLSTTQEALAHDCLRSTHSIMSDVQDPREIEAMFDTISYKKGAALIRMLQNFLDTDTDVLRIGLSNYLHQYQYSNARTDDLWRALSNVTPNSSVNVTSVMERWVRQKGYPLVSASRQRNKVFLTQKRFLLCSDCEFPPTNQSDSDTTLTTFTTPSYPSLNPLDPSEQDEHSPFDYQWIVPVSAITSKEPRRPKLLWLRSGQSAFFLDAGVDWYKLNANSSGFFRVNYDRANWVKLSNLLRKRDFHRHVLSPADRANLLDDALALMRADQLPADLALNITLYLEVSERDYVPWESALQHFYTFDALMLGHPLLHRYLRKILSPSVTHLGWRAVDTHLNSKLRQSLLHAAAWFGDEPTIRQARQYFDSCMRSGYQVPADLRLVVYSSAVRAGGVAEWNFCWAKYINTKVPSEQRLLLKALSHSRQPWLLSQLLSYALDREKIRTQDAAQVISDVATNPIGRPLAWRFVREHWSRIVQLFGQGSFTMDEIVSQTAGHFATRFEYEETRRFFASVQLGSGVQAVQQTLERIRANIFWKEQVERKVIQWLRSVPYA